MTATRYHVYLTRRDETESYRTETNQALAPVKQTVTVDAPDASYGCTFENKKSLDRDIREGATC